MSTGGVESPLGTESTCPGSPVALTEKDGPESLVISRRTRDKMEARLANVSSKSRSAGSEKALTSGDFARQFTVADVLKHNSYKDCWIIINKKIYDVTEFADRHPGGYDLLLKCGGRDVSEIFHQYHPMAVYNRLPQFYVGDLVDYHPDGVVKAIADLGDELEREGLFEADPIRTVKTTVWSLSLLGVGICLIMLGRLRQSGFLQLCSAPFIAGHFQQIAFLGHDTGHCAFTTTRWIDQWYGLVIGNLLSGISIGWWKDSHNTHHVYTNVCPHDPDIQHLPFLAMSTNFFKSLFSFYHNRKMVFDEFARSLVSYQHYLFYPVMGVARFNLYFQSVMYMLFRPRVEKRRTEIIFMCVFWLWFAWLLSLCNSLFIAGGVLLTSHALAGLLHVQIVLSHMACHTYMDVPYDNDSQQWFDVQLSTSIDVECDPSMDWFHGGLQFQVTHHLFPRMPRHHLREATERVKKLCANTGRTYRSDTFFGCNKKMLENLKSVAMAARSGRFVKSGSGMIWDGLNASG